MGQTSLTAEQCYENTIEFPAGILLQAGHSHEKNSTRQSFSIDIPLKNNGVSAFLGRSF
jgi:hypothetical protein